MTVYLSDAAMLAATLHRGQVDKHGAPYIEHLTAVVTILRERWPDAPEWAVDAAWLHDALEDHPVPEELLRLFGLDERTLAAMHRLTRERHVPYADYIATLAASDELWAIRIKLADNAHNSAEGRAIPELVAKRYGPARVVLEAAERRLSGEGVS